MTCFINAIYAFWRAVERLAKQIVDPILDHLLVPILVTNGRTGMIYSSFEPSHRAESNGGCFIEF